MSEQLISLDTQNATTNKKESFSVEIVPICKDDLVCLPQKSARAMSNIAQLCVCHRVGNQLYLIDPITLNLAALSSNDYWRTPFPPLASVPQAIEFIVLDIEPTSHPPKTAKGGRFLLADAQVSPLGGTMSSDVIFHTRTHLGAVLKPGDTVLGYLLANSNYNNEAFETLKQDRIPSAVLVRKTFPNRRKQKKPRNWKLRSMVKQVGGENIEGADVIGLGREKAEVKSKRAGAVRPPFLSLLRLLPHERLADAPRLPVHPQSDQAKAEADYERFLQDLEEDEELRQTVQLFKDPNAAQAQADTMRDEDGDTDLEGGSDDDDDDFPEIRVDDLLDEMDALAIAEDEDGDARIQE